MSEDRFQLAPSWLPRPQRRTIDRALRKLMARDACSVCGRELQHNTRTFSGLDRQGNVAVAGECCVGQIASLFGMGLYSDRKYDFLSAEGKPDGSADLTCEQMDAAIEAYRQAIASTDKQVGAAARRGGVAGTSGISVLDHPWKRDDRDWFEQKPMRSHRLRSPFPGEADEEAAATPPEHALIMLVRQVEPGTRLKATFYLNAGLLPAPDLEAVAHALFEVAARREDVPGNPQALRALVEKYSAVAS